LPSGTLEPGKLADLAVLSEDILEARPDEIESVEVEMTVVGRRPQWREVSMGMFLRIAGAMLLLACTVLLAGCPPGGGT